MLLSSILKSPYSKQDEQASSRDEAGQEPPRNISHGSSNSPSLTQRVLIPFGEEARIPSHDTVMDNQSPHEEGGIGGTLLLDGSSAQDTPEHGRDTALLPNELSFYVQQREEQAGYATLQTEASTGYPVMGRAYGTSLSDVYARLLNTYLRIQEAAYDANVRDIERQAAWLSRMREEDWRDERLFWRSLSLLERIIQHLPSVQRQRIIGRIPDWNKLEEELEYYLTYHRKH